MAGLRKMFVGIGLAVGLAVASGPAALAQDTDNSSANDGNNSVSPGDIRTSQNNTGGARQVGNELNRTSNVNQGTHSISGGVTSGGVPVPASGLASTASAGAPAPKASGAKAATKSAGAAATGGDLARTGSYTTQLALLGFGALLVGCLMVRYSWRPRMLVSASATHVREALSALAELHSRA